MRFLSTFTAFAQCISVVLSAELRIQISPSGLIPNPSTLPPSTHATLTGKTGERRALLRKDNTILFSDISSTGSHLLKIYTRDYVFASYRVDLTQTQDDSSDNFVDKASATQISAIAETYLGTQWSDHGVALIPAGSPVSTYTLIPRTLLKKNFYDERPGFSPLSLLKSPMILLGGVALLFAFGLPKLMENMDPEMKAEFEEMQKKGPTAQLGRAMSGQGSGGAGGAQGFDLAGYLAGSGSSGTKTTGRENAGNARERKR